jgi:hypothetical protein
MEKIMFGNIMGLSFWWHKPEIFYYTVIRENADVAWIKTHNGIQKIQKEGRLFETLEDATQHMLDLIQSEINHCATKSAETKKMISDVQTEMDIIQEQFPNMKVINLLKEKIVELQEKDMGLQQDLDSFQTSMAIVKEKYER